jgi:hypothetical protein
MLGVHPAADGEDRVVEAREELGGDALLAHEERRQAPEYVRALLVRKGSPVLDVAVELDGVGLPLLALPQLVELLGVWSAARRAGAHAARVALAHGRGA